MSMLERNRRRKEKKQQEPSVMPESNKPQATVEQSLPATGDVNTPDPVPVQTQVQSPALSPAESRVINDTPNPLTPPSATIASTATAPDLTIAKDNTPEWVKAGSYEDLVKINPNVSRGQYAYELAKYRREQGQPDMTYQEWANIIKNQDPFETEAERKKRENRMKRAYILNGVGSVLGNLVNYVRTRNGHVAMNLDDGSQGYNRLDRLRLGREQLARSNAKDYLGIIAQDRAERAKAEAAEAARQQRERDYQYKEARLKIDIENAKNERERKAAADELAKLKFKYQQEKDAATQKETRRHNLATESISRERLNDGGGTSGYDVGTSVTSSEGNIMVRKKPLSQEEAQQIVMSTREGQDASYQAMFRKKTATVNDSGQTVRTGDVDWVEMASWLMSQQRVPENELESRGFRKWNGEQKKAKTVNGFDSGNKTNSKTIEGFG